LRRFKANLPTKIIKKNRIKPNLFRVKFKFDNLEYINEWLLQFGDKIIINKPNILIEKRNDILNDMIQ
ncbi:MAG: YafY family transcriptional regulator, partial [Balneolaceae bacterium]|nr:YafY family transcriptional regulator [Balneolaceae bacterium]